MAQTIALQRGTTTVTTDGTTAVTLFTQSGGIATRVIFNALGISFATAANTGGVYIALFHQQSGGQATLIGYLNTNNTTKNYQFNPGASPDNDFLGVYSSGQNSIMPAAPVLRSGASSMSANAGSVSFTYQGGSNTQLSLMAKNFYMGPGDSLFMKIDARYQSGKSQSTTTANISYSFTTITES